MGKVADTACASSQSIFDLRFSMKELEKAKEHPIFANILVGAKHFGSKSLVIANKLSAEMLRPYKIPDAPESDPIDRSRTPDQVA